MEKIFKWFLFLYITNILITFQFYSSKPFIQDNDYDQNERRSEKKKKDLFKIS